MFYRLMQARLKEVASVYPVVALLGPRQSGKTTVVKATFPECNYVLLEEKDNREFALSDPRGFLAHFRNSNGLIIDEAQYCPDLFSYIQGIVDEADSPGMFVLTGSQNFHLNERISQTLAGRVSILTLLPLMLSELQQNIRLPEKYEELLFQGCYPRIHCKHYEPGMWYQNYITTFVERDVRQLQKVTDLHLFQKFLGLCAGRVGQLMNWSELGRDCGISTKTVHSWISLLEASYLVFLLQPHTQNFSKRLVKSPKLYFYDTGLLCALLRIQSAEQLSTYYLKGAVFESFVLSELAKGAFNAGQKPSLYFWRDKLGHEVDCLIDKGGEITPLEIKSAKTVDMSFFKELAYWCRLANRKPEEAVLVYGGDLKQQRSMGKILGWAHIGEL